MNLPLLVVIIVTLLALLAVAPFLLIAWWERHEQRRLIEEVQRFLAPGAMVRRAAVGRVRFPAWHTAVVVGLVVVALLLPWAGAQILALVTAAVLCAVGYRPRVVATTDDGIVVLATTWSWHPLRVVARLDHSAWRRPARGLAPQTLGEEVIVLRWGQARSLPHEPDRAP